MTEIEPKDEKKKTPVWVIILVLYIGLCVLAAILLLTLPNDKYETTQLICKCILFPIYGGMYFFSASTGSSL